MSKDMKLIMERWDKFTLQEVGERMARLKRQRQRNAKATKARNLDPNTITTVGQLLQYLNDLDSSGFRGLKIPSNNTINTIASFISDIGIDLTVGVPGVGDAVGGTIRKVAKDALAKALAASVMIFANLPDRDWTPGSAAFYFDMNDEMQKFFRHLETKGTDMENPSEVENLVLNEMVRIIKKRLTRPEYDLDSPLTQILRDATATKVARIAAIKGELGGKVNLIPLENT